MTDKTQTEAMVTEVLDQLQSLEGKEYEEKCKFIYDVVNPPKKEKKPKNEDEELPKKKKDSEEPGQLSPALVSKALNEHFDALEAVLLKKYNKWLALIIVRLLMIFHQDKELPQHLSSVLMKIGPEAFSARGADFTRNAGVYLARYYKQDKACKDLLM